MGMNCIFALRDKNPNPLLRSVIETPAPAAAAAATVAAAASTGNFSHSSGM